MKDNDYTIIKEYEFNHSCEYQIEKYLGKVCKKCYKQAVGCARVINIHNSLITSESLEYYCMKHIKKIAEMCARQNE